MAERMWRPAIGFIFVTVMLDVMAMGLVMPVLPQLVEQFAGSNAAAGRWNGVLVALWAAMQLLFSPLIGSLSDRFGRRPVILVSTAGLAADWVLMALAPSLGWLAVGRLIGGITSASFTTAFAYLADITPAERRPRAYGLIGAAFSAGLIAGPLVGGLLGAWGPRVPFWAAAVLSALAFCYGALVLPESLPADRRMEFSWRRANPFGALRLLRSNAELGRLAAVNFLLYFAHYLFASIFVLYAARRYGFGPLEAGLLIAFAGVLEMLVQTLLVGPVVERLGERRTMVFGLTAGAAGIVAMGLAPNGLAFTAALLPNALWVLAFPTLQSLMTGHVSEREQGQLQGANNSVASIAGIASPLFFGWVYGWSAGWMAGLSFFISGALLGGAALLGWTIARRADR